MTEAGGDALDPAPWEAPALLRRAGLGTGPIPPADYGPCWALACLTADARELREILAAFQAEWDALPDGRHRACGHGRRLRAFLDGAAFLRCGGPPTDADLRALLALPVPQPRPRP